MSEQDTTRGPSPTAIEDSPAVDPGDEPRGDDRNEELDESPIPDPTEKEPGAGDDPGAD
jgi:hypothetical protein